MVHPHPTAEPEKASWGCHIPPQGGLNWETEVNWQSGRMGVILVTLERLRIYFLHRITLNLNIAKRGKKVIGETQENKILNAGRGKRAKSLNPKLQVGVAGLQRDAKRRVLPSLTHCLGWECSLSAEQELCSSAAREAYGRNKHFLAANTAPNSMIITFAGLSGIVLKIKLDSRKLRSMKKSLSRQFYLWVWRKSEERESCLPPSKIDCALLCSISAYLRIWKLGPCFHRMPCFEPKVFRFRIYVS